MKAEEFPSWHEDFKPVFNEVMRSHGKEVRKELEAIRKHQEEARAADPECFILSEENLLLAAVGYWIRKNGTAEQKRISLTWIDNMYAMGKRYVEEKVEKEVSGA